MCARFWTSWNGGGTLHHLQAHGHYMLTISHIYTQGRDRTCYPRDMLRAALLAYCMQFLIGECVRSYRAFEADANASACNGDTHRILTTYRGFRVLGSRYFLGVKRSLTVS